MIYGEIMVNKSHFFAAACAMLLATSAHAATIQYDGTTVTGVSGLTVDGQVYDALFYEGTYNQLLIDFPDPEFDTNYTYEFAEAATRALYGFAVTDGGFSGVSSVDINGCGYTDCWFSTSVNQNSLTAWSFHYQASSWAFPAYWPDHFNPDAESIQLAHIVWLESAAVPVPAAVWLFGSGLLGLFGVAKRKVRT